MSNIEFIPKTPPLYQTILAFDLQPNDTTATLATELLINGVALSGLIVISVDIGQADPEYILGTLSGTTFAILVRNLDPLDPTITGGVFTATHGQGAVVKITDYGTIQMMRNILQGITPLQNPLISLNPAVLPTDVPNFSQLQGAIIAGGMPASTTIMGIVRLAQNYSQILGNPTITIASPAVITLANHGLTLNDIVVFSTSGTLPTGIVAGTPYYVVSPTTNTFEIAATASGTPINTSGSQTGTQTVTKVTPTALSGNANTNAALAGTSGIPSTANKFETENDTSNGATETATTISFSAPSSILDSGNGFVTAGFRVGDSIQVSGSASNNNTFTIVAVAAGIITVAETNVVNEIAGATDTVATVIAGKLIRAGANGKVPSSIIPSSVPAPFSLPVGENITALQTVYEGIDQPTPVTFDAKTIQADAWSGTTTNIVRPLTVGNNSNRYLLVSICVANSIGTASVAACDYAGVPMTLLQSNGQQYLFGIANPAIGNNNITYTVTGSGGGAGGAIVTTGYSYYNVGSITSLKTTSVPYVNINNTIESGVTVGFMLGALSGATGGISSAQLPNNTSFLYSTPAATSVGDTGSIDVTGAEYIVSTTTGTFSNPDSFFAVNLQPFVTPLYGYAKLTTTSTAWPYLGNFDRSLKFLGFALNSVSVGNQVSIQNVGIISGLSGLTTNAIYYISDTPGAISTTPGTLGRKIGIALSATTLLLFPEKSMTRTGIAKTAAITYTAETDGFLSFIGSGSITVNSVVVAKASSTSNTAFAPVSRGQTYVLDVTGLFIPLI